MLLVPLRLITTTNAVSINTLVGQRPINCSKLAQTRTASTAKISRRMILRAGLLTWQKPLITRLDTKRRIVIITPTTAGLAFNVMPLLDTLVMPTSPVNQVCFHSSSIFPHHLYRWYAFNISRCIVAKHSLFELCCVSTPMQD